MPSWTASDFNGTVWTQKIATAYYCSPVGDDRNNGAPYAPVTTPTAAYSKFGNNISVVCSSATYNDSLANTRIDLIGDGLVNFDGLGANMLINAGTIKNCNIKNYFNLGAYLPTLDNCFVSNVAYSMAVAIWNTGLQMATWTNSVFKNCFAASNAQAFVSTLTVAKCTFINSPLEIYTRNQYGGGSSTLRDNIFDAASPIKFSTEQYAGGFVYFAYNNVLGTIDGLNLADWRAAHPTLGANCETLAPDFANAAADVYLLNSTSPIRSLASDGLQMGAKGVGVGFSNGDEANAVNATWDAAKQQFTPTDPALTMRVEFAGRFLNAVFAAKNNELAGDEDITDGQTIDSTYSYENVGGVAVDTPSGSLVARSVYWVNGYDTVVYNSQTYANGAFIATVPGVVSYTTTGSGKVVKIIELPNIRVYELKWGTANTAVAAKAEADARGWKKFKFNTVPTWNPGTGKTNGEPDFDPATAEPILYSYLEPAVTILPNSLG